MVTWMHTGARLDRCVVMRVQKLARYAYTPCHSHVYTYEHIRTRTRTSEACARTNFPTKFHQNICWLAPIQYSLLVIDKGYSHFTREADLDNEYYGSSLAAK